MLGHTHQKTQKIPKNTKLKTIMSKQNIYKDKKIEKSPDKALKRKLSLTIKFIGIQFLLIDEVIKRYYQ